MKEYEVNIIETASRIVTVTASNAEMAKRIVRDMYCDDEITLDYADHDYTDYVVMED